MQSAKQQTGTNYIAVIEITNADFQNVPDRQVSDMPLTGFHSIYTLQ